MLAPAPAASPITTRYNRARVRKLEAVVAAMAEAGVQARWLGAEFKLDGLERVSGPDRALLDRLLPEIRTQLAEPGTEDPEGLPELLDIEVEIVDDPEQAHRVIAELPPAVALDIETCPRNPAPPPALRLTRSGRRYATQPKPDGSGAALDPYRGRPRLISVFDPGRATTFVFDMNYLSYSELEGLFDRRVLAHNSMFELTMLGAQGVELHNVVDTFQIASLALGCADKVRRLDNVGREILGIDLSKDLQTSYWAARSLSDAQLSYAACDPAVTYRAGRRMYELLGERERSAFQLANRAVPAIARMRLRGLPFGTAVHAETIAGWQREYAREQQLFHELTGGEVPAGAPAVRAWLTERLPPAALEAWRRTATGLLSIEAAELKKREVDWPEIRPLLAVRRAEKRLEAFGSALLTMVSPVTGRLHGDYFLPVKTGRLSCSRPNLQQLPDDVRRAVMAPAGRVLIVADFSQVELRVISELAGEEVMRAAFASGEDIHAVTAAGLVGCPIEQVTPAARKAAKPANFGLIYGMGTLALREKAFHDYGLEWSFEEADQVRDRFFELYPALRPFQRANARRAEEDGVLHSISGRPLKAIWEHGGEIWFTQACNYCVQSSAADLMLDAMFRADRVLPGTLIASVHDELVLEVPEEEAEQAAAKLVEQMTAAFSRWFPEAPTLGLVDVAIRPCWAKPETETAAYSRAAAVSTDHARSVPE